MFPFVPRRSQIPLRRKNDVLWYSVIDIEKLLCTFRRQRWRLLSEESKGVRIGQG